MRSAGGGSDLVGLFVDVAGSALGTTGSVTPTAGTFETAMATYVSPVGDPNAGQQLIVVLRTSQSPASRFDFDNVRLSDNAATLVATPEPGSWFLLTGALAILVLGRRKISSVRSRG